MVIYIVLKTTKQLVGGASIQQYLDMLAIVFYID